MNSHANNKCIKIEVHKINIIGKKCPNIKINKIKYLNCQLILLHNKIKHNIINHLNNHQDPIYQNLIFHLTLIHLSLQSQLLINYNLHNKIFHKIIFSHHNKIYNKINNSNKCIMHLHLILKNHNLKYQPLTGHKYQT